MHWQVLRCAWLWLLWQHPQPVLDFPPVRYWLLLVMPFIVCYIQLTPRVLVSRRSIDLSNSPKLTGSIPRASRWPDTIQCLCFCFTSARKQKVETSVVRACRSIKLSNCALTGSIPNLSTLPALS